jgi:hypothetical protein
MQRVRNRSVLIVFSADTLTLGGTGTAQVAGTSHPISFNFTAQR